MFKKIKILFSCDGIKGLINNPEELLITSKSHYLKRMGEYLKQRAKAQRIKTINGSSKPIITIILPVYNSAETISKAIKSIENQSCTHWELIIIDDGSTDGTLDIAKSAVKKGQKIRVFQNIENKGVAYSRNVGLYFAEGEFITFHDADDTSHPERLEFQLFYLLSKPSYKLSIPLYVRVNDSGVSYIINGKRKWNRVSGMMFSKDMISEIGYFKATHISEDSEYHERILAVCGKRSRKIIKKVLYYALFSLDSLLFSNANVEVDGNKVNYKINSKEAVVLEGYRKEHKEIKAGNLSPYQSFEIDSEITTIVK